MKNTKRVLLSLLAAVMLFGCFGVMASADGDYITYTVKGGDTALGICEGLKIDFFANQAWISEVNGIGSYNNIKVNQVLYLPTFDTSKDLARANRAKEEIKKASATAKPAVGTSAAPAAVGTTTMGDSVVSYLVNYKLQPGETVADVCAKLGVDFNANAEKIKKLSGITNYYHVPAGQIVVIPSSTVPQGSSYTQIVAHKVKAGETAAIICGQYKLDLAKVEGQLKALNNTENLSRISVGQIFYLPVAVGTASAPSGTAATAAKPAANNSNAAAASNGTAAATTTTAGDSIVSYLVNYKLQAGETVGSVCAKLGVDFDANAEKIKKLSGFSNYYHVPAGQMIVIPCTSVPQGYSYTAIVAHKVKGGETAAIICGQYKLDFAKVEGQLKALNNTENLSRISVGQTFYLPVPGGTASAAVNNAGAAAGNAASNGSTAAPAAVTGQVYRITPQSSAHGTFVTQVGGQNSTTAPAGSDVKIIAEPENGYKVYSITVTKTGTNQAFPVGDAYFIMPNCDVTVTVSFKTVQ